MINNSEQKNIEVELRGPVSIEDVKKIEEFLSRNGKFRTSKDRVLIDYTSEGIKERERDIRLRSTNGIPEIIVKLGKWGGRRNKKGNFCGCQRGRF